MKRNEKLQIRQNGSSVIRTMIMATANGRKKKNNSRYVTLTQAKCSLTFSSSAVAFQLRYSISLCGRHTHRFFPPTSCSRGFFFPQQAFSPHPPPAPRPTTHPPLAPPALQLLPQTLTFSIKVMTYTCTFFQAHVIACSSASYMLSLFCTANYLCSPSTLKNV